MRVLGPHPRYAGSQTEGVAQCTAPSQSLGDSGAHRSVRKPSPGVEAYGTETGKSMQESVLLLN